VIVHDFDLIGVASAPNKAYPVLVIDPDAVLPLPITVQFLKPVRRREGSDHCGKPVCAHNQKQQSRIRRQVPERLDLPGINSSIDQGACKVKSSTEASYHERIARVVGFLSNQVNSNPSLETLADIAAISPYHFHRVYRALTGETPSSTVRRLRLAKACVMLRDTRRPVTEVAFDVGYDSSQSFAKAFRAATGFTPSAIRKDLASLEKILEQLGKPGVLPSQTPRDLEVKVVSVDPFKVIASRHLGPHKGLFKAYGELFHWAETTGLVARFRGIYGIPIDDPRDLPDGECRFDCCFDFGPDAGGNGQFREDRLGGGMFAVTRHIGPYEGLEVKYDYLYGAWLSGSAYALRDQPAYNHYLNDPDSAPPEQWETDIYVPVECTSRS
jgi:AraC family transcriptional regulator